MGLVLIWHTSCQLRRVHSSQLNSTLLSLLSSRVMSFIEKSVARLDQLERLEALAIELGKSHYRYNAPPKYYSVRPWYYIL